MAQTLLDFITANVRISSAKRWTLLVYSGLFCGLTGLSGCGDGEARGIAQVAPATDGEVAENRRNSPAFPADDPAIGISVPRDYWPSVPSTMSGEEVLVAIDGGGARSASQSAARALEEADIVKIDGDRLYAMSRYGGLSIVDTSDRSRLTLLGQAKLDAIPFELYLRGQTSLALYQGLGRWLKDEATQGWSWQTTAEVVAFDVSVPSTPKIIGRFTIPGDISDSRIVGNVLYVVGYESRGCWGCGAKPRTTIVALSVADPAHVAKVDELSFEESEGTYSWNRSVTVTPERMYVAGPTWGASGPTGSTIDIIDISNPNGRLVRGSSVQVAGAIQSRWQMDEYQGHLRVISQPLSWSLIEVPRLQVFKVDSSSSVTALASLDLKLPERESLRSARFDGSRGYAITAVQTDPLFTFDLSNPAEPKQLGELVMPGWIYHIEPRANLLLGLGFDQGNTAGTLAVSLFDVSQLDQPKMLSRVNFGGTWARLPEDQDRIHKAFGVFDTEGLILVPFEGYEYSNDCAGHRRSGVQLIDWAENQLHARALAETDDNVRRGLLLEDDLLTVSDQKLNRFDISDRDHPARITDLPVAPQIQRVAVSGNRIFRMTANDWDEAVEFDVVPVERAGSPASAARMKLSLGFVDCATRRQFADFAVGQDRAYVAYTESVQDSGNQRSQPRLLTLDITQEGAPKVLADAVVSGIVGWNFLRNSDVLDVSRNLTLLGDRQIVVHVAALPRSNDYDFRSEELVILDLAEPRAPRVHTVYRGDLKQAPTQAINIGQSTGSGTALHGIHVSDSVLVYGTTEAVPNMMGKVRYVMHRVEFSDPTELKTLNAIDIPGALLAYDDASGRLVSLNSERIVDSSSTYADCSARYEYFDWRANSDMWFDNQPGQCRTLRQQLTLSVTDGHDITVLGFHELEAGQMLGGISTGSNRLFASLAQGYNGIRLGCSDCRLAKSTAVRLIALRGHQSGEFASGAITFDALDYSGAVAMTAVGDKAVATTGYAGELVTVDAGDVRRPKVAGRTEQIGRVYDIVASGNTVVAAMGYDGVATFEVQQSR